MYTKVFLATAFSSTSPKEVAVLKDCLFCIDDKGIIDRIVHPDHDDYDSMLNEYVHTDAFHKIDKGSYLLPGFVDLHIHASQWAQAGTALDIPLHDWLSTYTFPSEAKFADLDYAKLVYEDVVSTLLANGTTTALYFATVHKEASVLLADICAKQGQRGLVGKVVMDLAQECHDFYRDADTQTALQDTEEFILEVK